MMLLKKESNNQIIACFIFQFNYFKSPKFRPRIQSGVPIGFINVVLINIFDIQILIMIIYLHEFFQIQKRM